jgi:AraC-like DNA-binding protein
MASLVVEPPFIDAFFEEIDVPVRQLELSSRAYSASTRAYRALAAMLSLHATSTPMLLEALLVELLSSTLLDLDHSQRGRVARLRAEGRAPGFLIRAKRAIYDTLRDETVGLAEIARACGMSRFHFVRQFRACTGLSPMRYRGLLRLDYAKQALARSSQTVLGIANDLGYGDLSTFNKAFKREVGVTPLRFREKSNFFRASPPLRK